MTTRDTKRKSQAPKRKTSASSAAKKSAAKRKSNAATNATTSKSPRRRSSAAKRAPAETPARPEPSDSAPPESSRQTSPASEERRLEVILRALPERELDALIERMGIRVDLKKRIDKPAQVARTLVRLPDVREPNRLPQASAELLRRIAEAGGLLVVTALPPGLESLVRRGIVFARVAGDDQGSIELMLPTAFIVQIKGWEGEDPRSLRALLSEAPFETASAIASHYLGRPSTPPIALSLEPAWEAIGHFEGLRQEVERCSHQERRLLDQLEQVGGEVDTQELMDLEREPMRVRGAYGVAAGRRGAAFSLEKRGLLFPLHPNRYVIPTQVASIIGQERRLEREQRRETIRSQVIEEDHLPRRARFSSAPGPLCVALTMALHEMGGEVKSGVGTPRSLVMRLTQRFGRDASGTALLVALSRAVGLWEGHLTVTTPPGSGTIAELSHLLFETWRRGGAWDEARAEPELLRVAQEHRDPSPAAVVREMVLDALVDLGEGQWVPYRELVAYLAHDPRAGALERLLSRWAGRVGVATPSEWDVAKRILLESLPTIGVVDLGGAALSDAEGNVDLAQLDEETLALRLTARGRRYIGGEPAAHSSHDHKFTETRQLQVSNTAQVARVLDLVPIVDLVSASSLLEFEVSPAAMSRGLAAGVDAEQMRARLAALAPLPAELETALDHAGTVIGRGTMTEAAGFVWIEDPEVRELLRLHSPAAELFVDPSPPSGLLVAAGVDVERLARRCRALGVEIDVEEGTPRARRTTVPPKRTSRPPKRSSRQGGKRSTIPPPAKSDRRRSVSWRPPPVRKSSSGTGGNRSTG